MPSSKYSGRRSTAKKPSICISPPPIVAVKWCAVDPLSQSVLPSEPAEMDVSAQDPALPETDTISVSYEDVANGEWIVTPNPILNNGAPNAAQWDNWMMPGVYVMEISFLWSDGGTCSKTITITV